MAESDGLLHVDWIRWLEQLKTRVETSLEINVEQIVGGGQPLTGVSDTNVTLALGGTPLTALLKATSLTMGWAGTLAAARLNANVVQSVVNDTNVIGSIAAQALTLGWTGTLAVGRGGTGTATTLTQGSVIFAGASGVYTQDNANLFWDDANNRLGVGTASPQHTVDVVASALPTTTQILKVTATLASSAVQEQGAVLTFTGAGSGANINRGLVVTLAAGYTGSSLTGAMNVNNQSLGTGTGGFNLGNANFGAQFATLANTAGHNIGLFGRARGSTGLNLGGNFLATESTNSPTLNVGLSGQALLATVNIGGFFGLISSPPAFSASCALIADNAAVAADIFQARDNGSVVFVVANGGFVGAGVAVPTAALHLKAGTATANTAPLKFTSGTSLTAAEAGTIEFTTDDYFATITTGPARKGIVLDDGTRLTSGTIPVATTNGRLIDGPTWGARQTYTETNVTTDRAFDADATSLDELADVVGTLIADLRAKNMVA